MILNNSLSFIYVWCLSAVMASVVEWTFARQDVNYEGLGRIFNDSHFIYYYYYYAGDFIEIGELCASNVSEISFVILIIIETVIFIKYF